MIDEKILLEELKTEYEKVEALYYDCDKDPFYAAELSALDEAIKIVKRQHKIGESADPKTVPASFWKEWENVCEKFRRLKH